jgi:hypothetical protein
MKARQRGHTPRISLQGRQPLLDLTLHRFLVKEQLVPQSFLSYLFPEVLGWVQF